MSFCIEHVGCKYNSYAALARLDANVSRLLTDCYVVGVDPAGWLASRGCARGAEEKVGSFS